MEKPKKKTVIAWYCPDIAINIGLKNYHGLPGIIMLLEEGSVVYKCTKIELNSKEKIKTNVKGKIITEKEYTDILKNNFAKKMGLKN